MEYPELTLLTAVFLLILSASFLGELSFTGNILTSNQVCGAFGCLELCTTSIDCATGLSCCETSWGTGLCDKQQNCDAIGIFTRTHEQVPVEKAPERITFDQQNDIAIPILISIMAVCAVFVVLWFLYRMPEQRMRRVGGEE